MSILSFSSSRLTLVVGLLGLLFWLQPSSAVAQFSSDTSPELRQQLEQADELRVEGELRETLTTLRSLQRDHPDNVDIQWRIAIIWVDLSTAADERHTRRSLAENALDAAEKALEMNSSNAWANLSRAVAAGQMARFAESTRDEVSHSRDIRTYAERALEIDSELALAYHLRARWHREVSKLGFVQRAVVSTVYGGLPSASMDQAIEDFERAIELEYRAFHHLELARTYVDVSRKDDARQELQRALDAPRTDPFDPRYKSEARDLLDEIQ